MGKNINMTQEQVNYLVENFDKYSMKEILKTLKLSDYVVRKKCNELGLSKQIHKKWTEDELIFLKNNYFNMTSEEISKVLGRNVNSINAKKDELGLLKMSFWSKEEVDFLISNYKRMTYNELGKKLNKTEGSVCAKCFDLNLYKDELPWSDDEKKFLEINYMNMKTADIAKYLNRTSCAIKLKASKLGLKKYPYSCDYNYFNEIDSEEKAYWLGFITADGWVSKNNKTNACAIGIELQYNDMNHLKKFNKSICGNYKITDRWRNIKHLSGSDNYKHECCIRIFSNIMFNDLEKYGVTNNKSYECFIPDINEDLIRHYFRGYFDGDGRFCLTNKNFSVSFITASQSLNDDIIELLKKNNFHINSFSYVNNFGTTMYSPSIDRLKDKLLFLDWIYKDCNIYLDRKYKKYVKAKQKYKDFTDNECLAS